MAERYITDPKTQILVQAGLTSRQAVLYETLARRGTQTATRASFFAGVPRTLGYKVLAELEELGLVVKKDEPGKVAKFIAAHPLKLKELADKRLNEARDAKLALESTMTTLISDFNTVAGAPGVRILEGVEGYKEFLGDLILENMPITMARSTAHMQYKEVFDISEAFIAKQSTLGAPLKLISSPSLPTDIVLYGDRVAITMYQNTLITMIIENMAINKTFTVLLTSIGK